MIFTEPRFFIFLAIVFIVHWSINQQTGGKIWLLAASLFFYSMWNWRFVPILLGITLVDYFASLIITRSTSERWRRSSLIVSLSANLTLLLIFKYYDFFVSSAASLLGQIGFGANLPLLNVVIPLGLSFHTFQAMAYTIDIYKLRAKPARSILDFALFITFFPQLVAGPIVRANDFLPVLQAERKLKHVDIRRYTLLFLIGFFKKACVSDNISVFVDRFYARPESFSTLGTWAAVLFYSIQIYCDFSGYTDMAIASSGLLGFELPANFRQPYLSQNVQEFWRRWHISMSSWFRDYVYIPLGGNRGPEVVVSRNLLITSVLSGLWHGADWKFVLWGLFHGLSLLAHRWFSRFYNGTRVLNILVTFVWVSFLWVLFRATNFTNALAVYRQCFDFRNGGAPLLDNPVMLLVGLSVLSYLAISVYPVEKLAKSIPPPLYYAALGSGYAFVFALANGNYLPFIYFQF